MVRLYSGAKLSLAINGDTLKKVDKEVIISINGYNIITTSDGSFAVEYYDETVKQTLYSQIQDGVVEIVK